MEEGGEREAGEGRKGEREREKERKNMNENEGSLPSSSFKATRSIELEPHPYDII